VITLLFAHRHAVLSASGVQTPVIGCGVACRPRGDTGIDGALWLRGCWCSGAGAWPATAALAGLRFRVAGPGDAAGLLALKERLGRETSFMLLEPGERSEGKEDVAADLGKVAGTINSVVILAETAGQLVGYVDARGGQFRRNRITAHMVIGVLAAASGHGIGSGLLRELELWARAHEIHRLELTVMAHNHRARQLYERAGFAVEGRRRECLLVDGRLVDELYMAKLLPRSTS
jgi:ribosomal protein S18 acetylase RimI-like enzyme